MISLPQSQLNGGAHAGSMTIPADTRLLCAKKNLYVRYVELCGPAIQGDALAKSYGRRIGKVTRIGFAGKICRKLRCLYMFLPITYSNVFEKPFWLPIFKNVSPQFGACGFCFAALGLRT